MDTSHVKTLIVAGAKIASLIEGLSDGLDLSDIGKAISAARAVPDAIASAKTALVEYAAMSDQDALEVETFVTTTFDLDDNNVEAVIEKALNVIIDLHGLAAFLKK